MKKRIKIVSIAVIVLLIVAYSVYAFLQPLAIETKTLKTETSEISFTESGIVVHSGERSVYSLVAGEVEEVLVREGDMVEEGQVLARLDGEAVELQVKQMAGTLDGYKAQLVGAEVAYQVSIDNLKGQRSSLYGQLQALEAQFGTDDQRALEQLLSDQSKFLYDQGLEDLEKNKELLNMGIISQSEYNAVENLVNTYESNYLQSQIGADGSDDVYEGNRNAIYGQIAAINATLEANTLESTRAYYQAMITATEASLEALKLQASSYNITAPMAGVVNSITIENTNVVTGVEEAFIIQGEGDVQVEVKVSTRDIGTVAVGDEVMLILDQRTGDAEVLGTVTYIATNAVVEISPLGIEERKVMVYIEPESTDILGAGYEMDVRFIVFSDGNKLIVPNSAIYTIDEQDTVMIIRDGRAVEVPVTLGYELTGETIVEEGLAEGDQVITDLDAKGLTPGKNVVSSNE